jgi:tetratricopeptide (TPR) repeat protein
VETYRDVAESYAGMLDFEKALEIAEGRSGEDSMEVAKVRQILAVVYIGLGRNEESLEQIGLAWMVYERLGLDVEHSQVEIDCANVHVLLGRSEEAMNYLKSVMRRSGKESEECALAYVTMAEILGFQDRTENSKGAWRLLVGLLMQRIP